MKGDIVKIQNREELLKRLRAETDERVRPRLIFLNAMANHGISYENASDICGLSLSTGYVWIRKWNAEGLKDKDIRTGRPPRLNDENMAQLKEILKSKAYWTTKEVVLEIKAHFDVDLSEDQTIKILRSQTSGDAPRSRAGGACEAPPHKDGNRLADQSLSRIMPFIPTAELWGITINKFNMLFSKPYPMDYRRPVNAEAILENQLDLVLSLLKEKGIKEEEIAIGFIDETRPQNTANTVKVWSFEKVRSIKNTTKFNTNTIGFYSIKGNSVSKFLDDSKAPSIASFLNDIKNSNEAFRAIVVIIDNFSSHKSGLVRQKAKELGIYLVYLPPYSPNLNPIEFIWKSIKRVLSTSFVPNLAEMRRIITESLCRFAECKSYAGYWIEKFISKNMNYKNLCG
jgi:transposase